MLCCFLVTLIKRGRSTFNTVDRKRTVTTFGMTSFVKLSRT